MTVVVDFSDGPWSEPEHLIRIHTNKLRMWLKAKLFSFAKGEPEHHLKPGDMFAVPSVRSIPFRC
jgi:hypothetical protein